MIKNKNKTGEDFSFEMDEEEDEYSNEAISILDEKMKLETERILIQGTSAILLHLTILENFLELF